MQTYFPLLPSIGGTYLAPLNEKEREAYHNIATISQLVGTTHMTTGITSSELPQMEDDVITEAPSISTVGPSVSRVGMASQVRTDQPRVVSIAEPPKVTNVNGADVQMEVYLHKLQKQVPWEEY